MLNYCGECKITVIESKPRVRKFKSIVWKTSGLVKFYKENVKL